MGPWVVQGYKGYIRDPHWTMKLPKDEIGETLRFRVHIAPIVSVPISPLSPLNKLSRLIVGGIS